MSAPAGGAGWRAAAGVLLTCLPAAAACATLSAAALAVVRPVAPVMTALQDSMTLEAIQAARYVYQPGPPQGACQHS